MTPRAAPMAPDDRRAAIVAAATPLYAELGSRVTTKQIAEAAGIAEGTIFRVFPDKLALIVAVAEQTINPPDGDEQLARAITGLPDLRSKVDATIAHVGSGIESAMQVLVALRSEILASGPVIERGGEPPVPPPFVHEAGQRLLDSLRDHVFAPHAEELRVDPATAAMLLRSLIFGRWHPGMQPPEQSLTPEQVADAILHGVAAPNAEEAD